jgi:hypothetical protein
MGVDYNSYVGSYIRVKNVPKPSVEEYFSCPTPKCGNHGKRISWTFCPECGIKMQLMQVASTERICVWKIAEKMDGNLFAALRDYKPKGMKNFDFFLPNINYGVKRSSHFDPCCETYALEIDSKDVQTETELFQEKFQKEIGFLRETFGKENVEVLWGVIGYAS